MLRRRRARLSLGEQSRRLTEAETELGLLGWQQAEYDEETQQQVQRIADCEREQVRLTNQSAALAREIHPLVAQREAARKEFEAQHSVLNAQIKALRAPLDEINDALDNLRQRLPTYDKRQAELDRELAEVSESYRALLTFGVQSAEAREEMLRLRERTVTIPNEKADLRVEHIRVIGEIKRLLARQEAETQRLQPVENQRDELKKAFAAADGTLWDRIKALKREKLAVNDQFDRLEASKANPYLEIGRVLADHNLGPMNQPEVLEKVRLLRFSVHELETELAESMAESAKEDVRTLRLSYSVWAFMAVVLLCLVVFLFSL
ncbi:MAG: hypothetical protein M3463_17370 [Verrucomicrobiota bacterium]|nr:hypothetical protein [Verrucomicrobiota bacterium]